MFKTQILADKLTHLTDARYFAARGVDTICFSVNDDEDIDKAVMSINAIKGWVQGPKIFLRPGFKDKDEILELCDGIMPDAVVIPFLSEVINKQSLPCSLFIDFIIESEDFIESGFTLINVMSPDGIICELRNEKALHSDWFLAFLNALTKKLIIFIKLGFENDNPSFLLSLPISGIAVEGGMEEKIGLKSFDKIDNLLDELEKK